MESGAAVPRRATGTSRHSAWPRGRARQAVPGSSAASVRRGACRAPPGVRELTEQGTRGLRPGGRPGQRGDRAARVEGEHSPEGRLSAHSETAPQLLPRPGDVGTEGQARQQGAGGSRPAEVTAGPQRAPVGLATQRGLSPGPFGGGGPRSPVCHASWARPVRASGRGRTGGPQAAVKRRRSGSRESSGSRSWEPPERASWACVRTRRSGWLRARPPHAACPRRSPLPGRSGSAWGRAAPLPARRPPQGRPPAWLRRPAPLSGRGQRRVGTRPYSLVCPPVRGGLGRCMCSDYQGSGPAAGGPGGEAPRERSGGCQHVRASWGVGTTHGSVLCGATTV